VAFKADVAILAIEPSLAARATGDWQTVQCEGHGQLRIVMASREARREHDGLPTSIGGQRAQVISLFEVAMLDFT
jgi:hypothetical protein